MTDEELLAELLSTEGAPLTLVAENTERVDPMLSVGRVNECLRCPYLQDVTCGKLLGNVYTLGRLAGVECPDGRWPHG
jgi:hypothetical protein